MTKKKSEKHSDIGVLDREKKKVSKPPKYKAVMYNDDYTPMDVVMIILIDIFHKPDVEAFRLMMQVHEKGKGIAGVYSKEICDTKCSRATAWARNMGYPFLVQPEKE